MAIARIDHIRMWGNQSVPIFSEDGVEDATQTWVEAGVLVAASTGEIAEASDGTVTEILGFACADATGTTGARVDYVPALPGLVFEATLDNQASSGLALAATHRYGFYGIYQDSTTGFFYLDINTDNTVRILALVDAICTVQGRVLATFLNQATIFDLPAL